MKRALISDIHGNLEALRAVLDDVREQGIREIYCLGDIIGYGPNPRECLDTVTEFDACILGNHDQAALFDPDGFNPVALRAIYWTREQLESGPGSPAAMSRRWDFLGELPSSKNEGEFLFVHGSPREPTNEYVFPEDVYNQTKMRSLFGRIELFCFQGHTHVPGVFTESGEFISPEECGYCYSLSDTKAMVNVGSVGQPRDSDPRACYTILEERQVRFRRVEYPFEETIAKIYAQPSLDNMLGDRLREGR
ncbi:MAG: metallophosphoesterase family protein [Planctomycetota bacterium]|nr:metallophosphoesterase family protein [Planctomycetota bacterium]MDA1178519.1 metallophosphoesterase family protein [Planctomycetota bacterium]